MSQINSFGSGGGSGTTVNTLTGNIGGAVGPIGGNINVVGDGTTITISGNPATHTLTASMIPGLYVQTLSDDAHVTATPLFGDIQLIGGTNITTTALGDTITISSSSSGFVPSYVNAHISPYVVLATDNYVSVDSSGLMIIQLPDAPATLHQYWIIKDRVGNASIQPITVTTVTGVVLIDGAANFIMNTDYQSINVLWNGISYEIF